LQNVRLMFDQILELQRMNVVIYTLYVYLTLPFYSRLKRYATVELFDIN